jgi:hypothetical protein
LRTEPVLRHHQWKRQVRVQCLDLHRGRHHLSGYQRGCDVRHRREPLPVRQRDDALCASRSLHRRSPRRRLRAHVHESMHSGRYRVHFVDRPRDVRSEQRYWLH